MAGHRANERHQVNGVDIEPAGANRPTIDLIEGTGVDITAVDDPANNRVRYTIDFDATEVCIPITVVIPDVTVAAAEAAFNALCAALADGCSRVVAFTGVAIYVGSVAPSLWYVHKFSDVCRVVELYPAPPF